MSPTAFKQQVTQLVSELTRCWELCEAIRANRKLGPTTDALNRLQAGLKSSASSIQVEFTTIRKLVGSRFDLGDETSRHSLNRSIREVQSDIQTRLADIAYKRRESHDPELPGFRDLLRKWHRIEENVTYTLEDLGQRLEDAKVAPKPKPQPKPEAKPEPKPAKQEQPKTKPIPHKADEVVISLKELDHLLEHMKNSWVEKNVAGQILYVNAFDDRKSQWEKPDGFIKALPKPTKPQKAPVWEEEKPTHKPKRTPTWEQYKQPMPPRRPVREDFWANEHGW
jgi:hypothetical protein